MAKNVRETETETGILTAALGITCHRQGPAPFLWKARQQALLAFRTLQPLSSLCSALVPAEQWMWLCFHKTLFTKTGAGLDVARGS